MNKKKDLDRDQHCRRNPFQVTSNLFVFYDLSVHLMKFEFYDELNLNEA
jgi:hypothetical protein